MKARRLRSRRLAIAVTGLALGLGLALYSMMVATSGPRPAQARSAIGVIASPRRPGVQAVSVPEVGGGVITATLRQAARSYEEGGPVRVLVSGRGESARVYDANGRPSRRWWLGVGAGLLIALSTVCGQRWGRVPVHRRAVK